MDWEALLQHSPADFIASLSSWLLPGEALATPKDLEAEARKEQSAGQVGDAKVFQSGTAETASSSAEVNSGLT